MKKFGGLNPVLNYCSRASGMLRAPYSSGIFQQFPPLTLNNGSCLAFTGKSFHYSQKKEADSLPNVKLFAEPIQLASQFRPVRDFVSLLSLLFMKFFYDRGFSPLSLEIGAKQALVSISQAIRQKNFAQLKQILEPNVFDEASKVIGLFSDESCSCFNIRSDFVSRVCRLWAKFRRDARSGTLYLDVFFVFQVWLGGNLQKDKDFFDELARDTVLGSQRDSKNSEQLWTMFQSVNSEVYRRLVFANILFTRKVSPSLSDWNVSAFNFFRPSDIE